MIKPYNFEEMSRWREINPLTKKPFKNWRWIGLQHNKAHTNPMRWYNDQVEARSKTPEEIDIILDKRRLKPMDLDKTKKKRIGYEQRLLDPYHMGNYLQPYSNTR